MDKIEELKKLLWILDSKHSVSIPQTKENIDYGVSRIYAVSTSTDYIAQEIVKLFCQPDVVGQREQLVCSCSRAKGIDHDEDGKAYCIDCGKYLEQTIP